MQSKCVTATGLTLEYFACLARHGITHVFNAWTAMPPISEQWSLAGSVTNPDLVSARFLLRQGRPFEAAVKAFSPYTNVKEVNEEARMAAVALIQARKTNPRGKTLIFVNNRLEGNALDTIAAIVGLAEN